MRRRLANGNGWTGDRTGLHPDETPPPQALQETLRCFVCRKRLRARPKAGPADASGGEWLWPVRVCSARCAADPLWSGGCSSHAGW